MNHRGKLLVVLAVVAGVGALVGHLVWRHEPSYQGRDLSAWLRDLEAEQMEKRAVAADAVKHIGPQAVPFLVERLKSPIPALKRETRLEEWRRRILEWLAKQSPGKRSDPRAEALAGFDALGPAAKDGLQALEKLLQENPPDPRVLYVVARMGPSGLPILERALTNAEKILRLEARVCVEMIRTRSDLLYRDIGSGPDAAIFERRLCQFNLRTLQAGFEDYRAQHPEQVFGGSVADLPPASPLPRDFMQDIQNNTAPSIEASGRCTRIGL